MPEFDCCLSITFVSPIHEIGSDTWIGWKDAGKPLEIKVVGEAGAVARIRLLPGVLKQPARTNWLKREGMRINPRTTDGTRNHEFPSVATVVEFQLSKGPNSLSVAAVFDFVVNQLPELWKQRYDNDLLFVECRPERIGLEWRDLDKSWRLLAKDGSESDWPGGDVVSGLPVVVAFRPTVQDLKSKLVRKERKSTAAKRQPMNQSVLERCDATMLQELVQAVGWVKDPRRKVTNDYPTGAVLAMICLARYAGARSMKQHARFVNLLSEDQRLALGLAKVEKQGKKKEMLCVPSDCMFNDFIAASRMSRSERYSASEYLEKYGCVKPPEGDRREVISERRVVGCFNDWLEMHRMTTFPTELKLWDKPKRPQRLSIVVKGLRDA